MMSAKGRRIWMVRPSRSRQLPDALAHCVAWPPERPFWSSVRMAASKLSRRTGLSQPGRSEEHTSELQSLMRISYAVFCLKTQHVSQYNNQTQNNTTEIHSII